MKAKSKIVALTLLSLAMTLGLSLVLPSLSTQTYVIAQQVGPVDTTQDTEVESTSEPTVYTPFQLEISVGTQSAWTKKVPITVKVMPTADTTRTNVTWDVPYGLEITDSKSKNYVAITKGEIYYREAKVIPIQEGTYTIAATATDWGYGENFASSISTTLTFGENKVTIPQTTNYITAVTMKYVVITLILVIIGVAIKLSWSRFMGIMKEWLKPPEY